MPYPNHEPSNDKFLKDVADHTLNIHLDNGVHRHITFGKGESYHMRFSLVTWPGYLAITGDMKDFVFSRTRDMFEFFRQKDINARYWAEKIVATSKNGGHRKFSTELYQQAIKDDFAGWKFKNAAEKKASWAAIKDEWDGLFRFGDGEGHDAVREAMDWKCPVSGNRFIDFWDHTFDDYTYHYIWCIRAIRWGIEQFDAAIATTKKVA